jgi:low affinity Fe/Cu permease
MVKEKFRAFAQAASEIAGSPWAFLFASVGVMIWLLLGPVFGFAELWWLIASTVCSVIPTLMVFLIQNMQNRDSKAMQLKLDELIRATEQARNHLIHLEAMSDTELEALEKDFQRVRIARPRAGATGQAPAAGFQTAETTRSTSSP